MDEPLSNLDAKLRVQMRTTVSRLQKRLGTTTVYVTHDQTEAMTLGDRVVVMRGGVVQQVGAPEELYERPRNLFVAGFIGSPAMNFLPATLEDGRLRTPLGRRRGPGRDAGQARAGRSRPRPHRRDPARALRGRRPGGRQAGRRPHLHGGRGGAGVAGLRQVRLLPGRGRPRHRQELEELAADAGTGDAPGAATRSSPGSIPPAGPGRVSSCGCGSTPASCTCSTPATAPTSPCDRTARRLVSGSRGR